MYDCNIVYVYVKYKLALNKYILGYINKKLFIFLLKLISFIHLNVCVCVCASGFGN